MLSEDIVKKMSKTENIYLEGLEIFFENRFTDFKYEESINKFYILISEKYLLFSPTVKFSEGMISRTSCQCREYCNYEGCKHITCLLKEIQKRWTFFEEKICERRIGINEKNLIDKYRKILSSEVEKNNTIKKSESNLMICLGVDKNKNLLIHFKIDGAKKIIISELSDFIDSYIEGKQYLYSGKVLFDFEKSNLNIQAQKIIDIITYAYKFDKSIIDIGNKSLFCRKNFKVPNFLLDDIAECLKDIKFEYNNKLTSIKTNYPEIDINISKRNNIIDILIDMDSNTNFRIYGSKLVLYKSDFYYVDSKYTKYLQPLESYFNSGDYKIVSFPDKYEIDVVNNFISVISKYVKFNFKESIKFYCEELKTKVFLDKYDTGIKVDILFKYGEYEIKFNDNSLIENKDQYLLRSKIDELKVMNIFNEFNFNIDNDCLILMNEDYIYEFLTIGIDKLSRLATIFYSDSFKFKINKRIVSNIEVKLLDNRLIEIKFYDLELSKDELLELFSKYKLKKKFYRLKSGKFINFDSKGLESMYKLIGEDFIKLNLIDDNRVLIPQNKAFYIDTIINEDNDIKWERNFNFKKLVEEIRQPEILEFEIPIEVKSVIRNYQVIGFNWLKSLAYYGLGGILADDMGLGKTLQIIAFLLSEKNKNDYKPSLVVVPTSLAYNWKEEIIKFAPSLNTLILLGNYEVRSKFFDEIRNYDIVITTYGLLKKDINFYSKIEFSYVIIDEAQHIKNPHTLSAKSVKNLLAKSYFALTGTPIENSLTELWSIFDFLMPNYFSTLNKFSNKYIKPIIYENDKKALIDLSKYIKPFIIRRLKKDVLSELPEKIEVRMICELKDEQKKLYFAYLTKAKNEICEEIKEVGFERSHMKILTILTRLRQICCHPSMFLENYLGGSGKFDSLFEILEDAISAEHRILIFSQFTTVLRLIKKELDIMKIGNLYLDGKIESKKRVDMINEFNNGSCPIFLLSLKAGGSGINLTSADIVIHFDPWWNPAVEDQATDRAYRIGQKNNVHVIKLVAKDTIEEKIFELHKRKKELIENVITPGENFLSKMTEDEIIGLFNHC